MRITITAVIPDKCGRICPFLHFDGLHDTCCLFGVVLMYECSGFKRCAPCKELMEAGKWSDDQITVKERV